MRNDPFGALTNIDLAEGSTSFYSLATLEASGVADLDRLPFSIRILLENALPLEFEEEGAAVARDAPDKCRGTGHPSSRCY